ERAPKSSFQGFASLRIAPAAAQLSWVSFAAHPQERVHFPGPLSHWRAMTGFPVSHPPKRNTFLEPSQRTDSGTGSGSMSVMGIYSQLRRENRLELLTRGTGTHIS